MTPETNTRLRLAFELRAGGATWEAVGQQVGRDPATCRRWPSRYRSAWDGFQAESWGQVFNLSDLSPDGRRDTLPAPGSSGSDRLKTCPHVGATACGERLPGAAPLHHGLVALALAVAARLNRLAMSAFTPPLAKAPL